jgi:glycerate 2-kinase
MKVIVAADKFKGSLSAAEVGAHLATGLYEARPGITVVQLPVADGGEGTVAAALSAGFRFVRVVAEGPTGQRVETGYAEREGVAIVEMADVSGLCLLSGDQLAPLTASSYGTGEVLKAALDAGSRRVVLGVGGSACTDGGAGMVQALGARVLDKTGRELARGGALLAGAHQLKLDALHPALSETELVLACDVNNPLLGSRGAAAVYGPQKGASDADVKQLDRALSHWADIVCATTGTDVSEHPGAGAAGGVGYAALALLGAVMRPGSELVLELIDFRGNLGDAALVITGEGSLDKQTLHGKAPMGVAAAAREAAVPVVAVAGRCELSAESLAEVGIRGVYAVTDLESDPQRCMRDAGVLLERLAARIAQDWLLDAR